MTYRRFATPITALATTIFAASLAIVPAAGATGAAGATRSISASGSTSYQPAPGADQLGIQPSELGPGLAEEADAAGAHSNGVNRSRSIAHGAPSVTRVPVTAGQGVSRTGPLQVLSTFRGLNHRQQRTANGGNQFSLEPPDQGLCVGNGVVMEIINDVLRFFGPDGTPLGGVHDLNTFFGYPAQ